VDEKIAGSLVLLVT